MSLTTKSHFFGYTLTIISGKWKLLIIYHLTKNGTVRYNALQQSDGLVHREEYPQIPSKVNYSLAEKGQTLWPITQEICQWGEYNNKH